MMLMLTSSTSTSAQNRKPSPKSTTTAITPLSVDTAYNNLRSHLATILATRPNLHQFHNGLRAVCGANDSLLRLSAATDTTHVLVEHIDHIMFGVSRLSFLLKYQGHQYPCIVLTEHGNVLAGTLTTRSTLLQGDGNAGDVMVADSIALAFALERHGSVFGCTPHLRDDFDSPFARYTIGNICDIEGGPPDLTCRMLAAVSQRDTVLLRGWLGSMSPEVQIESSRGLLLLERLGTPLSVLDRARIDSVQLAGLHVRTCGGLLAGNVEEAGHMLAPEAIEQARREFIRAGYLVAYHKR